VSHLFLGLDAGNSKTVVLVADEQGRVLSRGRGGVGDVYGRGGAEAAVQAVTSTVRAAVEAAGAEVGALDGAALRLAGVDWPEDEAFWVDAVGTHLPELRSFSVRNDGFALLRCGRPDGVGVAVTAGSGPAVAARGDDGREYCACWWIQHALAGRGLGEAAFRAVVDAELGVGPATELTTALLELYAYPDVSTLLHAFTRRDDRRPDHETWAAARPVLRAAGDGDPVARAIVDREAVLFARLSRAAAERTGLLGSGSAVPVVLGGSILTSEHPAYRTALVTALTAELGPVDVAASTVSPVVGALLDALAEGGVELDADQHARVLRTTHPAGFLVT
jgi:N-acetylglucosamine kinase-like BadF-type ATPase